MKRLQLILMVLASAVIFSSCGSMGSMYEEDYYDDDESLYGRRTNVNMDMFRRELSPFGQWVNMPRYGEVWVTNERGFRPYYSGGRWQNTRYGQTWISDYSWGWAPMHYGKWGYDQFYGWFWVPGYDWSPAWVNWRYNNNYYGWSPYMVNGGNDMNHWIFADQRYLNDPRSRDRYIFGNQQPDIYRNSQPIDRPRPNITTYRQQQQQRERNDDMFDNRSRSIYRDATPNTRGGFPRTDVIERPTRVERPGVGKVERLDPPAQMQRPQPQQQGQRPASEVIRNNERREFKSELPQRERPVEHIKKENE